MPTIRDLFDLSGRVAIVTGGSRGLGLEMAEGLAEAGAALVLCARREEWLTPAVSDLRARGFRVEGALCDVAQPDQVQAVVNQALTPGARREPDRRVPVLAGGRPRDAAAPVRARELAASWGRQGIRVNAIAPGFFHSRLADVAIPLAEPGIKEFSPLGRVGAPGELKGVAVFLAADASNYITGQTIVVDGGGTIS